MIHSPQLSTPDDILTTIRAAFAQDHPHSYWTTVGQHAVSAGIPLAVLMDRLHVATAERAASDAGGGIANAFAHLRDISAHVLDGYITASRDQREASLRDTTALLASRQAELSALHRVNAAVNSSLDEQAILTMVATTVTAVTQAEVCSIYMYQPPDTLVLRATQGLNPNAIGRARLYMGEGLTGLAAREGHPVAAIDTWTDSRTKYIPETSEEPFHSMLSVPIILYTQGQLFGVLNIQTRAPKEYSREEIAFVEMVCGELALALENARLHQRTDAQLQRKVTELTTLRRVVALVASALDFQRVLDMIADSAVTLSGADASAIFELKRSTNELLVVATRGVPDVLLPDRGIDAQGFLGQSIKDVCPVTIHDTLTSLDGRTMTDNPGDTQQFTFQSMFCVPFQGRRDVCGAICVYTRERRNFNQDTIDLLIDFANEAAIAIDNAKLYEEARRSLVAKSTLLSEMHHRVKNNLQTVASLLSLGLRHTKSPEAAATLQESKARIQSIAAVHDLLSQEDVGLTTVAQVAKKVIEIAEVHFRDPQQRIRFTLTGDQVHIASQQATTLAMVLNELFSNAMRHAFTGRQQGSVEIMARQVGAQVEVSVADDGTGLPPSFSVERDKGLGLSIVDTLTRHDLHGKLDCRPGPDGVGTVVILSFPRA